MKISIISVLYNQTLTEGNTWKTLILPAMQRRKSQAAERCGTEDGKPEASRPEISRPEIPGEVPAFAEPGETDRANDIGIILADNSDDPHIRQENRSAAEEYGAVYLDMQGNRGLPAAYNRAIQESESGTDRSRDGWIVTADQDTCFPDAYVQVLEETAGQTTCDVLAPVVKAGEKFLSPCRRKGSRFVPYTSDISGTGELQNAFFINTGLAFRRSVFEDPEIRYDEQLFLDFVDFDLICRLRTRNRNKVLFGLLPGAALQQQFSGAEQRTPEQDLNRFRHFVHDGRLFYERWYGKGAAESAIRSRALRLAAKHRDMRFLKMLK